LPQFWKIISQGICHMMPDDVNTEELVARAREGDPLARQQLLVRHRERLRRMVAFRLDRRLIGRVDASDVVQEALLAAAQKLNDYLEEQPLPFYPWLRQLTWERLVKMQQQHLHVAKRSVVREEAQAGGLPDESMLELAQRLVASGTSPSRRLVREEMRDRVRAALAQMPERDRELLVLRYLEQMSTREIAFVLQSTEGAVKTRHTRALARLCGLLGPDMTKEGG
jgi:RNA polymerase sigma-70 factor (ECF subfamily)